MIDKEALIIKTTEVTEFHGEKRQNHLKTPRNPAVKFFNFVDFLVILFCVSGAAFSLNLFRLDLFQTTASINKKPVGAVIVKYNNVQRRLSDRVLWNRLAVESPVYSGDLIRVAELSAAALRINDDDIELNENTLIRIRTSAEGAGRVVIDLGSGSLSVSGGANADSPDAVESGGAAISGIALNIMGRLVAPEAGTILSASAGESGATVQVNEGSALVTDENGRSLVLFSGEKLTLATEAGEQAQAEALPSAVVTAPRPNARFVKNSPEPLNVRFAWNVVNIEQKQPLRLEISADRGFVRITRAIEGAGIGAAALAAGTWYWRLLYQGAVLDTGRLSIADAAAPALISPIQDSLFLCRETLPSIRFEWRPVEEASCYVLEAGLAPDFREPLITRRTAVTSFVEPVTETGTWYWRVKPVFSPLYEGTADFSPTASFRVELAGAAAAGSASAAIAASTTMSAATAATAASELMASSAVMLVLPEPSAAVAAEANTATAVAAEPAAAAKLQPEPAPKQAPKAAAPPKPARLPEQASLPKQATPAPLPPLPEAKTPLHPLVQQIKFEDLRAKRRIDFSWLPVEGANAYIFTLSQRMNSGELRQIIQTEPLKKTEWTLNKLALLDNGNFVWQVEAVFINQNGKIERRGRKTENMFVVDFPPSANLEIDDIGVIYGQ